MQLRYSIFNGKSPRQEARAQRILNSTISVTLYNTDYLSQSSVTKSKKRSCLLIPSKQPQKSNI